VNVRADLGGVNTQELCNDKIPVQETALRREGEG